MTKTVVDSSAAAEPAQPTDLLAEPAAPIEPSNPARLDRGSARPTPTAPAPPPAEPPAGVGGRFRIPAADLPPEIRRRLAAGISSLKSSGGRFLAPCAVAAATFVFQIGLALWNWNRMGYGAFDLTIFDQAVRNYSRLQPPRVPLKGVYAHTGTGFLQLGDHFSPIHALAAPLYWIWSDARMLLVLQAALYAAAAATIWLIARDRLGPSAATITAAAFGTSWGLQEATLAGYHELDWAVLLIPLAVLRLQRGHPGQAFTVVLGLCLVKEELGLVVAVFGGLLWLRGHRRLGAAAAVIGVVWSALAITVIVPAIGGAADAYWSYGSLGKTPGQALTHIASHPLQTIGLLFSTPDKLNLWLWLLAASAGTALLSPLALLAVPSLLLRLLSDTATYSMVKFHYNAPLMSILFVAAVDGASRLVNRFQAGAGRGGPAYDAAAPPTAGSDPVRLGVRLWLAGLACVSLLGLQVLATGGRAPSESRHQSAFVAATRHTLTIIPRNASVEAESSIAVVLSSRTPRLTLAEPGRPHGSEWAVLGVPDPVNWPWTGPKQIQQSVAWYQAHGYQQVWAGSGVYVLHRIGPDATGVWAR